ncbi:MAG: TraX family protein [Lachnospiraceae bacterium]
MNTSKHFSGFTGTQLKLIAIVTMLLDHIGAILLEKGLLPRISSAVFGGHSIRYLPADYTFWSHADLCLRFIGRLAFPIFCFLLVEGFLHTKSVARYALRLGLFALISEVPFDLALYKEFWNTGMQNVFFTLFLGLAALAGIQYLESFFLKHAPKLRFLSLLPLIVCMILAELLRTDYAAFGVLLIGLLYLLRRDRKRQCIVGAVATVWELTAPLAFLLIYYYNGERGKLRSKYFFYLFYPVHLFLLALIRNLLF